MPTGGQPPSFLPGGARRDEAHGEETDWVSSSGTFWEVLGGPGRFWEVLGGSGRFSGPVRPVS
ncbi:hypothetical protein EYF80_012565 [Liparis tanakae]|uniref:Uncharacterized protein n=1 Tax=Liparis tanakae TaxID=230148 RepID=A0A4Z2IHE7_9TELE|nr:hypothetical protein EYF80_012565 [Liparis tanakae]